jgi:hypothetical protein
VLSVGLGVIVGVAVGVLVLVGVGVIEGVGVIDGVGEIVGVQVGTGPPNPVMVSWYSPALNDELSTRT